MLCRGTLILVQSLGCMELQVMFYSYVLNMSRSVLLLHVKSKVVCYVVFVSSTVKSTVVCLVVFVSVHPV